MSDPTNPARPPEGGTGEADDERAISVEAELSIVNEFAAVRIRKLRTRNGHRLEIHSPRLGQTVRLDALELEALSWQTPEHFSALLAEPFGPAPSPAAAPADEEDRT
jgi:hypothetical protein